MRVNKESAEDPSVIAAHKVISVAREHLEAVDRDLPAVHTHLSEMGLLHTLRQLIDDLMCPITQSILVCSSLTPHLYFIAVGTLEQVMPCPLAPTTGHQQWLQWWPASPCPWAKVHKSAYPLAIFSTASAWNRGQKPNGWTCDTKCKG